VSVPTSEPTQLVGNDKDIHGCIGSAGYTWCDTKQKCLRVWEESCEATTPQPTVDETNILKDSIKKAIVAKHGPNANGLTISVSKIQGDYAQGGASEPGVGGGMWFAAKVDGSWTLVWDGNGVILCKDLISYPNFPNSMIPECFNDATNKTVVR
jgi:hypothetical protein